MSSTETIFYHNNNFSQSERWSLFNVLFFLIGISLFLFLRIAYDSWHSYIVLFIFFIKDTYKLIKRKFTENNTPVFTFSEEYFIIHNGFHKGKYLKNDIASIEMFNDIITFFLINPEKQVSFSAEEIINEDQELFLEKVKELSENFKIEKTNWGLN